MFTFHVDSKTKSNRFARTVLWRVRKPIGSVKVNVRTVKIGTLHYVYNDIPVIAIEFHGPGHDASI